jgi:GNAT superfamily N-acetyltransferase
VFESPEPDPAARDRFVEVVAGLVGDRVEEVFGFFCRIGEAHPVEPHWYLAAVGTMPEHQGSGAGAAILTPVLARCDAEGLPAYLESSNPRNVPFYHRLGFAETGTLSTPDGTATMTLMWRTPR